MQEMRNVVQFEMLDANLKTLTEPFTRMSAASPAALGSSDNTWVDGDALTLLHQDIERMKATLNAMPATVSKELMTETLNQCYAAFRSPQMRSLLVTDLYDRVSVPVPTFRRY